MAAPATPAAPDSVVRQVIIVGSGPAGLTAAIYASRASLRPLLIEGEPSGAGDQPGGQLMNTTEIENFPGVIGAQGPELMATMRRQAASFGTEILTQRVTKVDFATHPLKVWVGETLYRAHTVIVSTGAKPVMLGLPREWDLLGRGLSTCATCDGFFFRDKDIAVVGGGDSAMEDATFLTKFARSVTIIHRRDKLRASKVMQDRAMANPKIKFHWNATVTALHGDTKLSGLTLSDTVSGISSQHNFDGLFIAIGHQPNSELLAGQLDLTDAGYIKTGAAVAADRAAADKQPGAALAVSATSVAGVFACGDVQDARYRQAVTSAGSGCMAALDAQKYLEDHEPVLAQAAAATARPAHPATT